MLPTGALEYELPPELIATEPAHPRDAARLMVISRERGEVVAHDVFRNVGAWLRSGDLLVVNATRVIPARFRGVRADTGGGAEGLYVDQLAESAGDDSLLWRVMLKMKRARAGVRVDVFDRAGGFSGVSLELVERALDEGWIVRVVGDVRDGWRGVLARVGLTPLPPYILAARRLREARVSDDADREEYQTVYAHADAETHTNEGAPGAPSNHHSVAAPTAGLHFTAQLMDQLRAASVDFAEVMLDVGLGTFKPVEAEYVQQHAMHGEFCRVSPEAARAIARTKARGGRVIAVGTTAARTLESFENLDDLAARGPAGLHTRLLITPGWRWRVVDGLMTNFHLPRTTLLAMVAALMESDERGGDGPEGACVHGVGIARLLSAYREGVRKRYRFYSYGDAMLVV